jgi:hypothetical protein
MIGWSQIAYGAVLSAVAAGLLVAVAVAQMRGPDRAPSWSRRLAIVFTGAASAGLGPVAWNAVLVATQARSFFVDAPVGVIPASWQDAGSGVFALALASLALGLGPLAGGSARRSAVLAGLCGLAAFLVDVYLY